MQGILSWDFECIELDQELILFCTIFFLTFYIHFQFKSYFLHHERKRDGRGFVFNFFKSFLHKVNEQMSWPQFFAGLYSTNKLGNKERIQFIQKLVPDIFQKRDQHTKAIFNGRTCSFSPIKKNNPFYFNNQTDKEKENLILEFRESFCTLKFPNPKAPSMENFVEIKRVEGRGRCLVVTKNIPLGKKTFKYSAIFSRYFVLNFVFKNVKGQRCCSKNHLLPVWTFLTKMWF